MLFQRSQSIEPTKHSMNTFIRNMFRQRPIMCMFIYQKVEFTMKWTVYSKWVHDSVYFNFNLSHWNRKKHTDSFVYYLYVLEMRHLFNFDEVKYSSRFTSLRTWYNAFQWCKCTIILSAVMHYHIIDKEKNVVVFFGW